MMTIWTVLLSIGVLAPQDVPTGSNPLLRRYREGEKLTYHMKGVNENWRYEIQADGIVKKDSDGTYFEECEWSHLVSEGKPVTLRPASVNFRQQLTLDPGHKPIFPNLSQVDPRLVGPLTDMLTFYVDVRLVVKDGKLVHPGDHFYLKHGTPASWADGHYTLIGESSIDFDLTLKNIDRAHNTATLLVRHVPPEKPEARLPAEWMLQPVADTPNNWSQVQKAGEGKYEAAAGKEIFDDEIVLSLADGKILSATMDNVVKTVERECIDAAVTQCGPPKPHSIRRQIEVSLEH